MHEDFTTGFACNGLLQELVLRWSCGYIGAK